MRIGVSLFLIAVGAILKFAVSEQVSGIDLGLVGVILMIVGAVGLVITLVLMSTRRRTDIVHQPGQMYTDGAGRVVERPARTTYVEPNDPQY